MSIPIWPQLIQQRDTIRILKFAFHRISVCHLLGQQLISKHTFHRIQPHLVQNLRSIHLIKNGSDCWFLRSPNTSNTTVFPVIQLILDKTVLIAPKIFGQGANSLPQAPNGSIFFMFSVRGFLPTQTLCRGKQKVNSAWWKRSHKATDKSCILYELHIQQWNVMFSLPDKTSADCR